ncbi:MAG: multiheme c-type cytochrome [Gemmata sp.]
MTTGFAGPQRAALLAVAFVALVLGLVGGPGPARSAAAQKDDKKEYPRPTDQQKKDHTLLGASSCQTCHNNPNPQGEAEYKQTLGFEFIRLWENRVWSAHDLHSMATRNLITKDTPGVNDDDRKKYLNATAQRMEEKLRKYRGKDYHVGTDKDCLACHASVIQPISLAPPSTWKTDSFAPIEEGVGCEMCHGHGSMYSERHKANRFSKENPGATKVVDWRNYPAEVKKDWGLVNLRDATTATQACASCHIGNKADGRFVTHDMFAAGHPPLPPLDLMAYAREQPRHWGFAHEMPYITKMAKDPINADRAYALYHYREGESFVARRFAESALAALGATANLGAQLADDAKAKNDGLDFAAFDCYSCHHNLKYPSERQDRGYVGRPGRPLYRPAAFALARLVVDHAGGMDKGDALKGAAAELDAAELELADAFTFKTYGDADKVKAATAKIAKWSDDTRKKLEVVRYTGAEVKKLFDKLIAVAADDKKPVGDPEVAQLYVWAVETLYIDLQPKDKTEKKEEPKALKDMRVALKGSVVTRLRPDTDFYYEQGISGPITKPTTTDSVESRLKDRMDIFNSFRAEPFRKAVGGVQAP